MPFCDLDRETHRVDDAAKLDDGPVAGALDEPPTMDSDGGVKEIAAQRPQPGQRSLLDIRPRRAGCSPTTSSDQELQRSFAFPPWVAPSDLPRYHEGRGGAFTIRQHEPGRRPRGVRSGAWPGHPEGAGRRQPRAAAQSELRCTPRRIPGCFSHMEYDI